MILIGLCCEGRSSFPGSRPSVPSLPTTVSPVPPLSCSAPAPASSSSQLSKVPAAVQVTGQPQVPTTKICTTGTLKKRWRREVQYILFRGSSAHHSSAMPVQAVDPAKVPFCNAKEEIRAGFEGSMGGGGWEQQDARGEWLCIIWRKVVLMSLLHLGSVYSLVLVPKTKLLWGKSRRRPLHPGHSAGARWLREDTALLRLRRARRCRSSADLQSVQFSILWSGQVFLPKEFAISARPPLLSWLMESRDTGLPCAATPMLSQLSYLARGRGAGNGG